MVTVTIDDKTIQVPEGTTVIRAADQAGVYIPRLCDHSHLTPYGGCRMCLVEVEGARSLQPSCTLPVSNNMVVHTNTDRIKEARKFVLTLIFSERNHFCPYCQVSGGDCELQNAAYDEGMTHWPLQPNWQSYEVDASNPYFVLENNRCILCRRCVRACGELVGNFTLGVEERGAKSTLIADLGVPLGESSCISCGTCIQVCPTGALIDRWSAYRGHLSDVDHTKSVCTGCSIGCGIDVFTRDNNLIRVDGDWDASINDGILCKLGRFIPMQDEEGNERILTPMVRKDGSLKAATWEEALDTVASRLKPLAGKADDGVAAMASTRLPIEALSVFNQTFAGGFKSNLVTSTEEGKYTRCTSNLADEKGQPFESTLEFAKSSDSVMAIGIDLVNDHEVAGFFVKRNLPKGTSLVLAHSSTSALDDMADCSLMHKKGSYIDVFRGISAAAVKLGIGKTASSIKPDAALKSASEKTGISTDDFLKAAHLLAHAEKPVIYLGIDFTEKASVEDMTALFEMANITGVLADNYSGLINLKGGANSLAAAQLGLEKPFKVNGHKAAYIALGDDKPSQRLIQQLDKIDFLVVQASYISQLTAQADVVLPVEIWSEQEGTYLNLEGKLQQSSKALQSEENIWSNEKVMSQVAHKLGFDIKDDWKKQINRRKSSVSIG